VRVPPPNDDFTNRIVIDGSTNVVYGTISGAAKEPGEPDHAGNPGGNSVWWTWTAPANGTVTFTASGLGSSTLLGVYSRSSVLNLSVLGSSISLNPSQLARVVLNVAAGAVCQIALDGNYGSDGHITLS